MRTPWRSVTFRDFTYNNDRLNRREVTKQLKSITDELFELKQEVRNNKMLYGNSGFVPVADGVIAIIEYLGIGLQPQFKFKAEKRKDDDS